MRADDVTALALPTYGSTVGPWLILERLDSGSYGVVFQAQRARHPAIPHFEDAGLWTSPQGHRYPYLVMEWVEGFTLYDWAREAGRSSRDVLRVLAQLAHGLEAIHAAGAVHRDVKGDNIRVTAQGRAVLLDFGSGWLPGARPLTDTTVPPGTTAYRSPEQLHFMWRFRKDPEAYWNARPSDDLYSLGVTAYRLVTGTYLPPVTESEDAKPRKLLRPRELATVALELDSAILQLLSEDGEARGTAKVVADLMERAAETAGSEADRPIRPAPAAAPTEKGAPLGSTHSSHPPRSSRPRPSAVPVRRPARGFPIWLSWASAAMVGGLVAVLLTEVRHAAPSSPPEPPEPSEQWVGTKDPPCGPKAFDYDGRCYVPSFTAPRQPTSEQP